MKKIIIFTLIMTMIFSITGCGKKSNKVQEPESEDVYYSAIPTWKMGTSTCSDGYGVMDYLYYEGKIYTSHVGWDGYMYVDDKEEFLNSEIVGESKGRVVYGTNSYSSDENIIYWWEECEAYAINGYDEDFCMGVLDEYDGDSYSAKFIIFQCLNDLTLNKGSELYKDKLQLDKTIKIEYIKNTSDSSQNMEIDLKDEKVKNFIDAIYEGEFQPEEDREFEKLASESDEYFYEIYNENSMSFIISVYPNIGYVILDTQTRIILKVDVAKAMEFVGMIK